MKKSQQNSAPPRGRLREAAAAVCLRHLPAGEIRHLESESRWRAAPLPCTRGWSPEIVRGPTDPSPRAAAGARDTRARPRRRRRRSRSSAVGTTAPVPRARIFSGDGPAAAWHRIEGAARGGRPPRFCSRASKLLYQPRMYSV